MNVLVQSSYLCSPAGSRGLNNSLRGRVKEGGKEGAFERGREEVAFQGGRERL